MKRKPFIILSLCFLLVCTTLLCACKGESGATADEAATEKTTVSQSVTETEIAQTTTENVTTTATENETSAEKANGDNSYIADAGPADRVETRKTATINTGGKDYTVNVGDRIIYTCYLTTPNPIENIQATLTYDDSVLWLRQSSSKEMFPTLSGTIYNANITGTILFNASEPVEGYDFTEKGTLVRLEFDVAKEGYTSIATAIEFMDELGGNAYINNYKILGDITCQETIS